jgi:hypothetical protein
MAKNKLAKPQRVSVSKRKLSETADAMEQTAVVAAVAGEMEMIDGAENWMRLPIWPLQASF